VCGFQQGKPHEVRQRKQARQEIRGKPTTASTGLPVTPSTKSNRNISSSSQLRWCEPGAPVLALSRVVTELSETAGPSTPLRSGRDDNSSFAIDLSSRPERSGVEGPAVFLSSLVYAGTPLLCTARRRATRASNRVESSVGSGEFASSMINGISVQPSTTASQPSSFMRSITR
jgi:hypothetical protein